MTCISTKKNQTETEPILQALAWSSKKKKEEKSTMH